MGRKSDKLYIKQSEWTSAFGGASAAQRAHAYGRTFIPNDSQSLVTSGPFKRLPFDCCAISLQKFNPEAVVCIRPKSDESLESTPVSLALSALPLCCCFDLVHLMPYLNKYKKHPISGEPISRDQLVPLKFHKNAQNQFWCPLTFKVFNEHSSIVANLKTGHVYAWDAVQQMNIKARHWFDLMEDLPMKRQDLVCLQDPQRIEARDFSRFEHIQQNKTAQDPAVTAEQGKLSYKMNTAGTTGRVLAALAAHQAAGTSPQQLNPALRLSAPIAPAVKASESHGPMSKVAASFTSTHMAPVTGLAPSPFQDNPLALSLFPHLPATCQFSLETALGSFLIRLDLSEHPRTSFCICQGIQRRIWHDQSFERLDRAVQLLPKEENVDLSRNQDLTVARDPGRGARHQMGGLVGLALDSMALYVTTGHCGLLDENTANYRIIGKVTSNQKKLDDLFDNVMQRQVICSALHLLEDPWQLARVKLQHAERAQTTSMRSVQSAVNRYLNAPASTRMSPYPRK